MSNLYQSSTGGIPVTADGQPVGLVLDKSRGAVLGDELVTNGTFDSDTSGWSSVNSTLSVVGGKLRVTTTTGGDWGDATQNFPVEAGKTYVATIGDITENTGQAYWSISNSGVNTGYVGNSTETLTFTPTSTGNCKITLRVSQTSGDNSDYDNISAREVLGIPAQQPVSTKRPTYNDNPDRLTLDLVDDGLLVTIPTGGWDGYMVLGTDQGTASYGVSLPAGDYELGGDYFPGNTINQVLFREGDVHPIDLKTVEQRFVNDGAKASYGDVTDFSSYWRDKGITEFPLIDTSSGIIFFAAWRDNNLTSFPLIDTSNVTSFNFAWAGNTSLSDFPANMFDNCLCTNFNYAFLSTNLTQSSIDGILVSIESNGASNGIFRQSGGSTPSATGEAAIDAMRSRGWTITVTGEY